MNLIGKMIIVYIIEFSEGSVRLELNLFVDSPLKQISVVSMIKTDPLEILYLV